ncbi:MAG: triosephosphate isomerase [Alphaproteobacteria bacterium]|nr:triosephosphate isomerase [Alphaproteobacteria bacterium]
MRRLLAGNWKMNGLRASLAEIRALNRGLAETPPRADILVCPPATLIAEAAKAVEGGPVAIGGQDCHPLASGAFTGDVSAEMLRDAGATAVILGHSERRLYHGEADSLIAAKVKAAQRAGLTAILCVGETETQRKQGQAGEVVAAQLEACVPAEIVVADLVVAYEPIWAIGTGKTPRAPEIAHMHGAVRALLTARFGAQGAEIRILYGGSVKPENGAEILALPNVDGALIGGASVKAGDFLAIIRAAPGH